MRQIRNKHLVNKEKYNKILLDKITCDYKKTNLENVNNSDYKTATIAKDLELADRITKHTTNPCYVTLKDTKPNAMNSLVPLVRLINGAKSEIQKASKIILDKINEEIRMCTQLNQWKNTNTVLNWFNSLKDKQSL